MKILKDYGFAWAVGGLFLISITVFLVSGWYNYVGEQELHGGILDRGSYWTLMLRDITENWQSEFVELLAEVILLRYLLFRDSPMSRDGDDRLHQKVDSIRRAVRRLEDAHDAGRF